MTQQIALGVVEQSRGGRIDACDLQVRRDHDDRILDTVEHLFEERTWHGRFLRIVILGRRLRSSIAVPIVHTDTDVGGLEVRRRDGDWETVPCIPGAFVVNLGDLMADWTNDRWVSTLHRVTVPKAGFRRQSIAYFQNPNYDAEIRCIPTCLSGDAPAKYSPVPAGKYLMDKFHAAL